MPQAKTTNHTRLSYETLFVTDEKNAPILTMVLKASFDIKPDGALKFAEQQIPVNLAGEHYGDPETTSYRYEPECAFVKENTDVAVIGNAISPKGPVEKLLVQIRIGDLFKQIGVIGNRTWEKQAVGYRMSAIEPFTSMPLIYENAFGGWDRRHEDESKHIFEASNTVGKGLYLPSVNPTGPMPLPNIEDPAQLIQSISDKPQPVGCGFTLPHWQPRAQLAGTYDDQWMANTPGVLPADFKRSFFNAASNGLVSNGYLAGNEQVEIRNMTESGTLSFTLPGAKSPVCEVVTSGGTDALTMNLDTVIIDTSNRTLQLLWRNYTVLPRSAHDVYSIDIRYG